LLKLGITGGIGSGKSLVCSIFKQLGTPIYNADDRAKTIVNTNIGLKSKIIQHFGELSYIHGEYNRKHISDIVFSDKNKLKLLNDIIHPVVFNDWKEFCIQHQKEKYIIKEAAIMLETESKNTVDKIVLVYSPLQLRIERTMKRDDSSEQEVLKKISNQMPEEEKLMLADYVIFNDGSTSLIEQVMDLHYELINTK